MLTFQKFIEIPQDIDVTINDNLITFKTSKINNQIDIPKYIQINYKDFVLILSTSKKNKPFLGLYKSLILNCVKSMLRKFKVTLNLNGIGFKGSVVHNSIILKLGYSHDVNVTIPKNLTVNVLNSTQIICIGNDWNELTQFVSNLRRLKKIDPYKGKGILFPYETIQCKEGKKNKK